MDQSFKRKKDLGEHKLKRCGKVDKDFQCGLCSKQFYSQETLQDHMGKLHYQFKRHICQKCTEGFYSRSELLAHEKNHEK